MLFVISLDPFSLSRLPPMVGKVVHALIAPEVSFIKSNVAWLNFLVVFFEVEHWRPGRNFPIHSLTPANHVVFLSTVPAEDERIQQAFTLVTRSVILPFQRKLSLV